MRKTSLALVLGLLALPAAAAPRPFLDLGFEAQECTSGWRTDGWLFETAIDGSVVSSGRQSLRIRYPDNFPWEPALASFPAIVSRDFPAEAAAGRRVRYSGFIRTEGMTGGAAELWWEVYDANDDVIAEASLGERAATGTTLWTRYEVELQVPATARWITFGVRSYGAGTAWFDGLAIEVDGRRWVDGPRPAAPRPNRAAVSWLRKEAIPFVTPVAGSGSADLQPLKRLVGNARIVALGEQSHGTREFFQMKHRLLEFLVEEMGFTHFAIEANMPEAYRVNDYVLTGQGDPVQLLRGMYFWTWRTQEVLDMILWMREHNASGKTPVQFLGFDMQVARVAVGIVRTFLGKADPEYARAAEPSLARIEAVDRTHRVTADDVAAARAVFEQMNSRRGGYLARSSREEVDWAIQNARILVQDMEDLAGITRRDASMAANVEWILDQAPPGSKIVLWAHNAHVRKRPGFMGSFLSQRFGPEMVVLGFAMGEGRYNTFGAQDLRDYGTLPPIPGSVEAYFQAAGIPRFVLDLRRVPSGAPASWLRQARPFRQLTETDHRCAFYPTVVANEYDGLIWLDRTTPSELLDRE